MSHPDGARPAPRLDPPAVPPGTSSNTPWIWVIVALPIFQALVNIVTPATTLMVADPNGIPTFSTGYYTLQVLLFLVYVATVVFAVLDWRELKKRGFVRPFHWAWSLLGAVVYIVGRSVVVFRRSGQGLAPLWVFLIGFALSFVVALVKATQIAGTVLDSVSGTS